MIHNSALQPHTYLAVVLGSGNYFVVIIHKVVSTSLSIATYHKIYITKSLQYTNM